MLVGSGLARWLARHRRGNTLVLAYHNVVPDDVAAGGDRSLHLPRAMFACQLDVLVEWCDVVPLASIFTDPAGAARPRVAITFDDAYYGALTIGATELRERRLPATMFVAPGLLGEDAFWWDALAGPEGLSDAVRRYVLDELRGDAGAAGEWASQVGRERQPLSPWSRPGEESGVLAWAEDSRLTLGAHTWRHANLARLAPDEVTVELAAPLAWLRERAPTRLVRCLTYPYGLANPGVTAAASAAGYDAAFAVSGGWIGRAIRDRYWVPRLNIPAGLTADGFRLRIAGIV